MSDTSTLVMVLRTVVSLAVVLAVLVVFMRWLDAQSSRHRRTRGEAAVPAAVLVRVPLSKGASVQVVRVGAQVLALGVTETHVNVLTDLGPGDLAAHSLAQDALDAPPDTADARLPGLGVLAGWGRQRRAADRQASAANELLATLIRNQGRHRDESGTGPANPTGPVLPAEPTNARGDTR